MFTSRGWRASPVGIFCAGVVAVMVFLLSHPAWDSALSPGSASQRVTAHSAHQASTPTNVTVIEPSRHTL